MVNAESHRAAASISTNGGAGGLVAVGSITNQGHVTPTVRSYIGTGASVVAEGRVDVLADILAQTDTAGAALDVFFKPGDGDVDTTNDAIRFYAHGLSNGATVTYNPNGNTPLQTPAGPLSPPPAGEAYTNPDGSPRTPTYADREYRVIVVDGDHVKLGSAFDAGSVDGALDVIRFAAPHGFLTGDAVKYDARGNNGIGLGSGTYYVQAIDDLTIALFASKAEAEAPARTITLASGDANQITVNGANFANGTRV
ncbi:MAG: hypothetical protein JSW31_04775, partial [Burkholderiales bacterium]